MRDFQEITANLRALVRENGGVAVWGLILAGAAVGAFVVTAASGVHDLPPLWTLLGLAAVAGIAERQGVRVTRNIEMSVSFLPLVFTAVAFGPLAAWVVGGLANLLDLRRPYLRWAVYTPARALAACLTGLAAYGISEAPDSGFGKILVAAFVAAVVYFGADVTMNTVTLLIRRSGTPLAFIKAVGPLTLVSLPLHVPLVALLVYASREYSLWVVATFLLPALALQRLLHLYQQERDTKADLAAANERLAQANLSFATALVATLDARDRYTAGHSAAVAIYSRDIAARMGLSDEQQQLAHIAGLVHDIGKVGLPPGLLEKAGPLTLDERRQMEQHAEIGARILAKVDDYAVIASIVRHHHERVDGRGYPDRLHEAEIPLVSRIIAVADAYNAMTSGRPYRDAMPTRVARLRLAQAAETQFDTAVLAAFEAILASSSESYRSGTREDFALARQEETVEFRRSEGAATG